jgi:AcrR family transcriptional regulator
MGSFPPRPRRVIAGANANASAEPFRLATGLRAASRASKVDERRVTLPRTENLVNPLAGAAPSPFMPQHTPKSSPGSTPKGATDRRAALLDAAVEQIAKRGTRGMRVEQVAKAAGVSPALIYHHFGDRTTLLIRALEHVGALADAYTTPPTGTARSRLLSVLVDEIQDAPRVRTNSTAWGELRDTAIFDSALRPTIAKLTQDWADDIAELVRAGQQDGTIAAAAEPEALGIQLSALVEGLSGRWLTGQLSTEAARQHVMDAAETLLGSAPSP